MKVPKKFFITNKKFGPKFFWPKFFCTAKKIQTKFFGAKQICWLKFFGPKKLFGTEIAPACFCLCSFLFVQQLFDIFLLCLLLNLLNFQHWRWLKRASFRVHPNTTGWFKETVNYKFAIALVVYHLESYGISAFFTDNGTFWYLIFKHINILYKRPNGNGL